VIAYHQNWTVLESEAVGRQYGNLIEQVRRAAGTAMHDAWNTPPVESGDAMNIPPAVIDLSGLAVYETAYISAVGAHLRALAPWWAR
jgi:hypothetical protein